MKRVPKFISEQYAGGSHEFRSRKRHAIRVILKQIEVLRLGSAFFPNGANTVDRMQQAAERIKYELSVKNWGR